MEHLFGKYSSVGNKSVSTRKNIRKDSEINPTYSNTNDSNTNDSIGQTSLFVEIKESKPKKFIAPDFEEVLKFFTENNQRKELARRAFDHYTKDGANWHDAKGNKVRNWKQKMRTNWFVKANAKAQKHNLKKIKY